MGGLARVCLTSPDSRAHAPRGRSGAFRQRARQRAAEELKGPLEASLPDAALKVAPTQAEKKGVKGGRKAFMKL